MDTTSYKQRCVHATKKDNFEQEEYFLQMMIAGVEPKVRTEMPHRNSISRLVRLFVTELWSWRGLIREKHEGLY